MTITQQIITIGLCIAGTMLLSIAWGTICYMLLLHFVF